jgi:MFS family permease
VAAKLKRDSFFWTLALQTFVVNFFLGGFGPSQPLLRADQGTSLTIAGRYGRAASGWIGLVIFSFGLLALALVQPVQLTILAAFITGFGCSTVINSFVVSMSNHYGALAPMAVAQANGVASTGYVIGTLTIGTIAQAAPDFWRLGLIMILPIALYLFFFRRKTNAEPHVPSETGPQSGKLSSAFWIAWLGFVATISTEFATTFWAAALVRDRTGATAAISVIAIMALGSGMAVGRFFGGPVMHKLTLDHQLLTIMALQLFSFFGIWFSHNLVVSLIALFLNGLGISTQFALSSIRLINHSDGRPELAIGKSALAAGIAIGGAPFLLGVLGDNFGISRAYLMVPALIVFAMAIVKIVPSYQPQESR